MKTLFKSVKATILSLPYLLAAQAAMAGVGGGLPWEVPVDTVESSITGPVLGSAIALCIVGSGIAMTQSSSAGVQSFSRLLFGASIAGGGAMLMGLFNVGAGALL